MKMFFQDVPFAALSGTLTVDQRKLLPSVLGLEDPTVVTETPDRPNIYLDRRPKLSTNSVVDAYESIYMSECEQLAESGDRYPVTLMYLPLEWCSQAASYCQQIFGREKHVDIGNCQYGVMFSKQDKTVLSVLTNDLKTDNPRVRLLFCTSSVGMGFNAPSIERVIHGKPPRNLSDYFQQVGRCGRAGQKASAVLYFNANDIARNLPGIQDNIINYCKTQSCLRDFILTTYGFTKDKNSPVGCQCCCVCEKNCECDVCLVNLTKHIEEITRL